MTVDQWRWAPPQPCPRTLPDADADLVLVFGGPEPMADLQAFETVRALYPAAVLVGASSSGEVLGDRVFDASLVVSALTFEQTAVTVGLVTLIEGEPSHSTGRRLAEALAAAGMGEGPLRHVFAFADGVHLNGSGFARGLEAGLPAGVTVTGGLAGDDARFERTPLWADAPLAAPGAVAVGLHGPSLAVGYGCAGGWDPFGPERLVTRSEGNVLYELDGRSALALYKEYLGPHAAQLPASGLLFPLAVRTGDGGYDLVRSALGIDETDQSITLAGDIPQGAYARFMKTNAERIIDAAHDATRAALAPTGDQPPDLALVVSCVGRRMVLTQRIEEELEEVGAGLPGVPLAGFYSHGELAPARSGARCELHNQTLTLTTLTEA